MDGQSQRDKRKTEMRAFTRSLYREGADLDDVFLQLADKLIDYVVDETAPRTAPVETPNRPGSGTWLPDAPETTTQRLVREGLEAPDKPRCYMCQDQRSVAVIAAAPTPGSRVVIINCPNCVSRGGNHAR